MTAQTAPASTGQPEAIYTNRAYFTAPFLCGGSCNQMVRPPRRTEDEPGMEGTRSYGGRGLCTPCYAGVQDQAPRKKRRVHPAMQAYTEHTLNVFLQRRMERLNAGSTAQRVNA